MHTSVHRPVPKFKGTPRTDTRWMSFPSYTDTYYFPTPNKFTFQKTERIMGYGEEAKIEHSSSHHRNIHLQSLFLRLLPKLNKKRAIWPHSYKQCLSCHHQCVPSERNHCALTILKASMGLSASHLQGGEEEQHQASLSLTSYKDFQDLETRQDWQAKPTQGL